MHAGRRSRLRAGRPGPLPPAILTALCLLSGCGSATATHPAASTTARPAGAARASSPSTGTPAATTTPVSAGCAATVAGMLGTVAGRVYHEAASGGDVAQAVHRVVSSSALQNAVNDNDAAAAAAALRELLLGQIVRVEVLRGGHMLARAGAGAAIAPVHGSIPGTSATFVLSTQSDHSYLQVVHQVTGAQVLLTTGSAGGARRLTGTIAGPPPASLPAAGPVTVAGRPFQTTTLTGTVYPAGALHIVLL